MRALNVLQQALSADLSALHSQRRQAVFRAVAGLMNGGRLWLTALGRALPGTCHDKHRIKAVDRLLGNRRLHEEVPIFYRGLTRWLLRKTRRPIVLVDWTGVGPRRCAITAAVAFRGRALPILSHVHPIHDYHARHAQQDFVRALREILPTGCTPTMVTDAGFHFLWFDAVRQQNWNFVGRLRGKRMLRSGQCKTSLKALHERASSASQDVGVWQISQYASTPYRIVLAAKKPCRGRKRLTRSRRTPGRGSTDKTSSRGAREPWVLATSLKQAPSEIVAIYGKRMQIEEGYRDLKNHRHGWSLNDIRCRSEARIEVMLMLAALANVALHIVGLAAEQQQLQRRFQANTVSHRRVLSSFLLGRLVISRRLELPDGVFARAKALLLTIIAQPAPRPP